MPEAASPRNATDRGSGSGMSAGSSGERGSAGYANLVHIQTSYPQFAPTDVNLKTFCLLAVLLATGCGEERSAGVGDAPFLEFRVGHRSPEPGFTAMEYEGSQIYLTPWVALDDSGIESLALERRASGVILTATLYSRASERLREITGRNVGEELAVLVHGEIRALVTIRSPLAGGHLPLQIRLNMDRQEADVFAEAVRARWAGGNGREPAP